MRKSLIYALTGVLSAGCAGPRNPGNIYRDTIKSLRSEHLMDETAKRIADTEAQKPYFPERVYKTAKEGDRVFTFDLVDGTKATWVVTRSRDDKGRKVNLENGTNGKPVVRNRLSFVFDGDNWTVLDYNGNLKLDGNDVAVRSREGQKPEYFSPAMVRRADGMPLYNTQLGPNSISSPDQIGTKYNNIVLGRLGDRMATVTEQVKAKLWEKLNADIPRTETEIQKDAEADKKLADATEAYKKTQLADALENRSKAAEEDRAKKAEEARLLDEKTQSIGTPQVQKGN
jgi:hypothetical protein